MRAPPSVRLSEANADRHLNLRLSAEGFRHEVTRWRFMGTLSLRSLKDLLIPFLSTNLLVVGLDNIPDVPQASNHKRRRRHRLLSASPLVRVFRGPSVSEAFAILHFLRGNMLEGR
jgi:hypothetical protein